MDQKKILIIDDDPDITEAMTVVLETQNYNVATAINSTDATEAINQSPPDVIILDVMMDSPREGFAFSRELKNNPDTKDIPILMITSVKDKIGIDFKEVAGDDSWLPVQDFLDKPVEPQVLIDRVAELLK